MVPELYACGAPPTLVLAVLLLQWSVPGVRLTEDRVVGCAALRASASDLLLVDTGKMLLAAAHDKLHLLRPTCRTMTFVRFSRVRCLPALKQDHTLTFVILSV